MKLKLPITLIGLLAGGWMIADGVHVLVTGKYFGPPEPGPWSVVVAQLGFDPFAIGPLFVTLGVLWLVFLAGLLRGNRWGWYGSVAVAVTSLWYVPIGTMLAVLYLVLLVVGKKQWVRSN